MLIKQSGLPQSQSRQHFVNCDPIQSIKICSAKTSLAFCKSLISRIYFFETVEDGLNLTKSYVKVKNIKPNKTPINIDENRSLASLLRRIQDSGYNNTGISCTIKIPKVMPKVAI